MSRLIQERLMIKLMSKVMEDVLTSLFTVEHVHVARIDVSLDDGGIDISEDRVGVDGGAVVSSGGGSVDFSVYSGACSRRWS